MKKFYTMKQYKHYLWLAVILLAGCVSQPKSTPSQTNPKWQAHEQQLLAMTNYQAAGQLGVITPQQRFSSQFTWRYKNAGNYDLRLSALLNTANVTLTKTPAGMRLVDGKNTRWVDENALLSDTLKLPLTWQTLALWLKGVPTTSHYQLKNIQGQPLLNEFTYQAGTQRWLVRYLSYQKATFGEKLLWLPENILLERQDSQKQKLKIHLSRWQPLATENAQ